jgi:murein L,D-transpeptidase YafK
MIGLVALTAVAAIWAGYWFNLSQERRDKKHIAYERSERRARVSLGLPLPGTPDLDNLEGRLEAKGLALGAPILIRIFKREFELELWMAKGGTYQKFATYPICRWSGRLGPKLKTGDSQAPEGFYYVGKAALNPNSRWHRSFNLGFPNAYDQAHGRTGSFLMVHGGCASVGCYAMTDAQITEIWRIVTAALDAGQPAFQVQAYPFRMTRDNLDAYQGHSNDPFWRDLAQGYDLFERTRLPPSAGVCAGRYTFEAGRSVAGATGLSGRCSQAADKN